MRTRRFTTTALLALALLGLCGASIFTVYGSYRAIERSDLRIALGNENERAQMEARWSIREDLPKRIEIDLSAGDVTIEAGRDSEIAVVEKRVAWERNAEAAELAVESIALQQRREGETLYLSWKVKEQLIIGDRGGPDAIHLEIRLPADIELSVQSGQGVVAIQDMRAPVEARVAFGSLHLEGLRAAVSGSSDTGQVVATDIQAGEEELHFSSEFGSVEVADLAGGKIVLQARSGTIEARGIRAEVGLEIESEFGSVELVDFDIPRMKAAARTGLLTLRDGRVRDGLEIEGGFGEIELESVDAGRYQIQSETGAVSLIGAKGELEIDVAFGDIRIEEAVAVALDLKSRNGGIDFAGSLEPGSTNRVETEFGDIRLRLPAEADLDLRFETEFGDLTTELPLTGTAGEPANREGRAASGPEGDKDGLKSRLEGRLNKGGTELWAKSQSGSVQLKALTTALPSESESESRAVDSPLQSASDSLP